jgi:class 3 adenylate cyclase
MTQTFAFTDLENHSEFVARVGDAEGRRAVSQYEQITREALGRHDGLEVKNTGDGLFVSFVRVSDALSWALDLQHSISVRSERPGTVPLRMKIGLNTGDAVEEGDDRFGNAINVAARATAEAGGGQIVATEVVRLLAYGSDFRFRDLGERSLKGVGPQRLWLVLDGPRDVKPAVRPPTLVATLVLGDSGHDVEIMNRGQYAAWDVVVENHERRPGAVDQFRSERVQAVLAGERRKVHMGDIPSTATDFRVASGFGIRLTWTDEGRPPARQAVFHAGSRRNEANFTHVA